MLAVRAVREVASTRYRAVTRDGDHIAADPEAIDELGDEIATLAAQCLITSRIRLRRWVCTTAAQRSAGTLGRGRAPWHP